MHWEAFSFVRISLITNFAAKPNQNSAYENFIETNHCHILMTLVQFSISASVCAYIPIVMSYSNDISIGDKNPPRRIPAYKECPVRVSLNAETGTLALDNTKCPYPVEYGIYNETGQLVCCGACSAYSYTNVNLNTLTEGVYQLKIQVGTSAYVGTIDI